jgi:DNA-binding NtrC family response regulator
VYNAASLAIARNELGARPHDLLILDIGLADGSGLDLLAETDVPAIVFTAQDGHPAMRTRASEILVKSRSNLDHLVAAAERLLVAREAV